MATAGADGLLHVYDVQVIAAVTATLHMMLRVPSFLCAQAKEKRWSWNAGVDRPGIFEIVWQQSGKFNRIAMAMEKCTVGVVDLTQIPELQ